MVERAGNPQKRIDVPGGSTVTRSDVVRTDGQSSTKAPALIQPDAPKEASEGAYHQRSLGGSGPSSLVGIRMAAADKSFRSPAAQKVAALLETVREPGVEQVAAAHVALDSAINYIDGRTDHGNQVGALHQEIAATPPEERVPLLRRTIHTLRQAVKDGVLPPHATRDLERLSKTAQGMGWNFDFDDNIASLDTKIVIYDRKTGEQKELSTTEFAEVRESIGKLGPLENYETRHGEGDQDSYRNFRDASDPGVFWRDLSQAMDTGKWQGPSWDAFQRAMSSPLTAKWSTIITARGHFPSTIHSALRTMQDQGHIENVPPVENIYPVNLPGLRERLQSSAQHPSGGKVRVMGSFLDRLQAAPMGPASRQVVSPDGKGKRFMHLWGFSDDDYGTFKKTVEDLGQQVKEGRWPDVKITVFFTGIGHPEAQPQAVVIKPDGTTRPRLPSEAREVDRALEGVAKLERAHGQV